MNSFREQVSVFDNYSMCVFAVTTDFEEQIFPFFLFVLQRSKKYGNIHIYLRILNKYSNKTNAVFTIFYNI